MNRKAFALLFALAAGTLAFRHVMSADFGPCTDVDGSNAGEASLDGEAYVSTER